MVGTAGSMPPSRPALQRCTCEECVAVDARGLLMDSKLIPAHLKHVQDESSRRKIPPVAQAACSSTQSSISPANDSSTQSPVTPTNNSSIQSSVTPTNDLVAHLFALTLTDDGPDPKNRANKLWESCVAYQDSGPGRCVVASAPNPLNVSDITESLGRLTLESPAPYPGPSEGPHLPVDNDSNTHLGHNPTKKDTNRHSTKALELITNIENRCQKCFRLSLDPSSSSLTTLREELVFLHGALDDIKHNTATVRLRKAEVVMALDRLEQELHSCTPPSAPLAPLKFDTGEITSRLDKNHA